jgi:predicted aldo/keto reductase-like oxidoreductase
MLYRTVPKNGDELSILGFGCMRLPLTKERQIDEPRAIRQIRVGRALSDSYRERVKIATKLPSWMIKKREDMDFYLNAQLEKLKTDHIDYYLIHGLAGDQWDRLVSHGVMDFLDRAKADGRIVNAGFSFHGILDDFFLSRHTG